MRAAFRRALARAAVGATVLMSGTVQADRVGNAFAFFEGITESVGTLDVIMHKQTATRNVGRGEVRRDGSLSLVQRVEDEGSSPHLRYWLIREIAPGHYSGSMSEASGPVTIDQVGSRYRFRFKISGGMSVEQWLTPLAGGRSASTDMTVRRFGIAVATAKGVVRKLS